MEHTNGLVLASLAAGLAGLLGPVACSDDESTPGGGGSTTGSSSSGASSSTSSTDSLGGGGVGGTGAAGCEQGGGGCANWIADGSFEEGSPSTDWQEASSNFGTPLCTAELCGGVGSGSGPSDCRWWAWFGGVSAAHEEASLTQALVIDGAAAVLRFELEMSACDGPQDYLEVWIDEDRVFRKDGADPLCGELGYELQAVDLGGYADGELHELRFHAETYAQFGSGSSFHVDEVSISECPIGGAGGVGGGGGAGGVGGGGGAGGMGGGGGAGGS